MRLDRGYQLRVIEQMPLDAGTMAARRHRPATTSWRPSADLTFRPSRRRAAPPPRLDHLDGGPATVGMIASVSKAFCATCDRTRLTADGKLRSCLFASSETDLRAAARWRR